MRKSSLKKQASFCARKKGGTIHRFSTAIKVMSSVCAIPPLKLRDFFLDVFNDFFSRFAGGLGDGPGESVYSKFIAIPVFSLDESIGIENEQVALCPL